jgi:hypothetical protein
MKLFAAMLAAGVLGSGMVVGAAFACDGDEDMPETAVVIAAEEAGACGGCDGAVQVVEKAGDCGGCDGATEVVVAEGDCGGCDSATKVVVAEGECEGCDSATQVVVAEGDCGGCDSATEAVAAEGGCGDCESVCGTCEVLTALADVELSDHGKAVLELGQAGVPVWIDEAGFGMVNGDKVDCPVAFSRAATQFIATMGAEAGCEICQTVLATAETEEAAEDTSVKSVPAEAAE